MNNQKPSNQLLQHPPRPVKLVNQRPADAVALLRPTIDATVTKEIESAAKKVIAPKLPLVNDIVQLSLTAIKQWLEETMTDDELRSERFKSAKDMAAIAQWVVKLNDLLRLEQGKQTSMTPVIQNNFDKAKILLQNIRAQDPVFEYPVVNEQKPRT